MPEPPGEEQGSATAWPGSLPLMDSPRDWLAAAAAAAVAAARSAAASSTAGVYATI
jgi:hypothetical protein